ncbi:MAG: tetratricopeptide repeat protein [Pirellulaceae bacterium]
MRRLALMGVLLSLTASFAAAREWTSAAGDSTLQGDLVKLEENVAILKLDDGRVVRVALANLSQADQDYARANPNGESLIPAKDDTPKPVQVKLDGDDRFTQDILSDPNNPSKYYARGLYYTNKGRLDEAINDFQKVAELAAATNNEKAAALAYNGLGRAHVEKGEFGQAHQDFTNAIEKDNRLAAAYRGRADNLHDYFNNSQEGKEDFEKQRAAYRKKRDGINKRYLQKFPWQPPNSTTDESLAQADIRNMQNVDYAMAEQIEYDYGGRGGDGGWGGGGYGGGGPAIVGPQVAVGGAVVGPGLAVYPPVAVKGEVIELVANPSELAKGMPVKVGPNAPKLKKGQEPTPEMMQAIKAVDFYRDVNGDGQFQPEDQYLTTDTEPSDGFSAQIATTGFTAGTHNYFAIPKSDGGLDQAALGALTLQENLLRAAAKSERDISEQLGAAANSTGLTQSGADLLGREQADINRIISDVQRKVKETAPEVAEQLDSAKKTAGMTYGDLNKAKREPGVASKAPAGSAQTNAQSVADQLDAAADALADITGSNKEEVAEGPSNPAAAGPVDPTAPGAATEPPKDNPVAGTGAAAAGTLNPPKGAAPGPGGPGGPGKDGPDVVINNYDRDGDGDVDDDDLVINNFDDDRDDLIDRAGGFYDDRDYDRALVDYDRVVEDRPYDIDALRGRARTHLASGGYEYAVRDYDRLIELAPRNADFYYNRGCAHLAAGRLAEADRDFTTSIEIDELQKLGNLAFNNRGITRARQGKFEDAINDFDKAILINRNDALAYRNRALAFKKSGDLESAQADLERFNELNVVVTKE